MKPTILLDGKFVQDDIDLDFSGQFARKIDDEIEVKIDAEWQSFSERKLSEGKMIWDATTYRLDKIAQNEGGVKLFLSEISFAKRIGARPFLKELNKLGERYHPQGISVVGIIQTSDGQFVLGHMTMKTLAENEFDVIGGVLSKDETPIESSVDIFGALLLEMQEEINIGREFVEEMYLRSIIQTERVQACFVFCAKLNINANEVHRRFIPNDELRGVKTCSKQEFAQILSFVSEYKVLISRFI